MTKNIIFAILFFILVIGNMWAIMFVHIPFLQKENKTSSWIGIGISVGAIALCGMALGKQLYILSLN